MLIGEGGEKAIAVRYRERSLWRDNKKIGGCMGKGGAGSNQGFFVVLIRAKKKFRLLPLP